MSKENLPFGWNERKNGVHVLPDAPPAGDWRAHNLGQKHTMSVMRDTEKKDESLPFGWTDRNNTKTLEELSLSTDSTNVAVAEVNLLDVAKSQEARAAAEREREREREKERERAGEGGSASDALLGSVAQAVTSALQPHLLPLTASLPGMDARLRTLESSVATMLKQQEMIIKLLIEQSNSKIESQIK